MTTFTEELYNILTLNMPVHPEHQIDKRNIEQTILNLVSERIIGENSPEVNDQFSPPTVDMAAMACNRLKEAQRTTLYEDTKEVTHTNNPTHTRTMKCKHSDPLCAPCKKELDAMYPTEQQATPTSEEELRKEMQNCMKDLAEEIADQFGGDYDKHPQEYLVDEYTAEAMQLLHQYGNTRELEGRLDERIEVALDNYRGQTFSASTNWEGKFRKFMESNGGRIIQLSKAKEQE